MNIRIGISYGIILLLVTACSRSLSPFEDLIPQQKSILLTDGGNTRDSIKILYVTCGMLIIERRNQAVLFDPFFSYQPGLRIPFAIRSSPQAFNNFSRNYDKTFNRSAVKAGFVSHSHYDHLLDLPLLIDKKFFPELRSVYGSEFVPEILFHHRYKGTRLIPLSQDTVFNPLDTVDQFKYIHVTDSISVLPIASMHAPHKFGILMMNGKIDSKYFQNDKFKDPLAASRGFKWDAGCSYSFLVKFKNADGTTFNIFVQTSASNEPYGLPPAGEPADLAVLCFASMQEVDDHPNYIMRKTKAKKLLLIHWEDFFGKQDSGRLRLIRSTNKKLAKRRVDDVRNSDLHPEVIMPRPGSLIKISY